MLKDHREGGLKAPDIVCSILVVIALPEEREYFFEVVEGRAQWDAADVRDMFDCFFDSSYGRVRVVVSTLPSMGNVESTLGASAGISAITPDLFILVGISGSMNPSRVLLGDVVLSNQAKLYASDKVGSTTDSRFRFSDCNQPDDAQYVIDHRDHFMTRSFLRYERKIIESKSTDLLIGGAKRALRADIAQLPRIDAGSLPEKHRSAHDARAEVQLHSGWVLSSPHVVDSLEYREYLTDKNLNTDADLHRQQNEPERVAWKSGELLAVDMESYGALRVVEHLRSTPSFLGGCPNLIGGLVVRGISDLCDEKGETDRGTGKQARKIAGQNATTTLLRMIETFNYAELMGL